MSRFLFAIWARFKEYIILLIFVLISLIFIAANNSSAAVKLRQTGFSIYASITSLFSGIFNFGGSAGDSEKLLKNNTELMLQINKLREYEITNKELKGLLEIKDTIRFPIQSATIISKSLNKSQGSFTLNVGKSEGVLPGMPVINDMGLVGIVHSVSDEFSIIRTLKNANLKLTIKDERSRLDGIMRWNGSDLIVTDIPKTGDIKPGDRIVISDLSSVVSYPVQIGIVKEIVNAETGFFLEAIIKPYVDFNKTEHVFVVKTIKSIEKNELELNFYNQHK